MHGIHILGFCKEISSNVSKPMKHIGRILVDQQRGGSCRDEEAPQHFRRKPHRDLKGPIASRTDGSRRRAEAPFPSISSESEWNILCKWMEPEADLTMAEGVSL